MVNAFGGSSPPPGVNPIGASTGLDLATPGNNAPMGGAGSITAGNVPVLQALMGNNGFGFTGQNLFNPNQTLSTPQVTAPSISPQDFMASAFTLLGANNSPFLAGPHPSGPTPGMPAAPMQTPTVPQQQPQQNTQPQFRRVTTPGPAPTIPQGWVQVGSDAQGVIVAPVGYGPWGIQGGGMTGPDPSWLGLSNSSPNYTGGWGTAANQNGNTLPNFGNRPEYVIPTAPSTTKFVRTG